MAALRLGMAPVGNVLAMAPVVDVGSAAPTYTLTAASHPWAEKHRERLDVPVHGCALFL